MPDFNELLQSESAQKLMNNQTAIHRIQTAPETKKLMEMLNQQTNGSLESIANEATQGSPKQLMNAMQTLLQNPESHNLLEQIRKTLSL